jgi:hypothetical protein
MTSLTLPVQNQVKEGHVYCYHYTTCTKARTINGHVYCYHYTTSTKPGQRAVMCIITITLPVQNQVKLTALCPGFVEVE